MAKILGLAIILTNTFSGLEGTSNLQERQQIADQFSTLCPFTAQCHRNATKENPGVTACCSSCSCHDDCLAMGNCCPDKRKVDLKPVQFSCKKTLVKRGNDDTSPEKKVYRGHDSGIKRYFIVDNCPGNVTRTETAEMCIGSENNSATLEDLVWVSDIDSGRIFQNKYCAECHGVTNIIQWQVLTTCFDILLANISTAVATVLSGRCSIIVGVPEEIAAATEKYLCFLPEYSRCNETGLWDKIDAKLEQSCLESTATYFYPTLFGYDLYKNVFCYVCNQRSQTIIIKDECPFSEEDNVKSTIKGLTSLLDYKRLTQPMTAEQVCGVTEIIDKYYKKCRGLFCPFPKTPFYGNCIQLSRNVSGIMVYVTFEIKVLGDWSVYNLNSSESEIGKAVYNAVIKNIGLKRAKCQICFAIVMRQSGLEAVSPQLYLFTEVYTTSRCQYDRFVELVSGALAKEIKITWSDKSSLTFQISIDQRSLIQDELATKSMYMSLTKICPTGYFYHLKTGKFCPQIEIARSEMSSFVARAGKSQRWLLEEGKLDEVSNGSFRICVDEYFAAFEQTNTAFRLSLARSSVIGCYLVLGLIVYDYTKHLL